MEYKRIKPDEKLLYATAPVGVAAIAFNDEYEIYMLAGMEGDRLMCYALYSHLPNSVSIAFLEYVYTIQGHRDSGLCTGLLLAGEEKLGKLGVENIVIRQISDPDNAVEYNEFFTKRGYLPLNLRGRMLYYRLSDMLDTEAIQTVIKHEKQLPEVKPVAAIGERYLKALLAKHKETGFFFSRQELDDRYSRFYEVGGIIHAAMIVSLINEKALFVSAIYGDKEADDKGLFMVLFSEVVYAVLKDTRKKDLDIIFVLHSEGTYDGLMKVFNPPDREFLLLEHMKTIGHEGK